MMTSFTLLFKDAINKISQTLKTSYLDHTKKKKYEDDTKNVILAKSLTKFPEINLELALRLIKVSLKRAYCCFTFHQEAGSVDKQAKEILIWASLVVFVQGLEIKFLVFLI